MSSILVNLQTGNKEAIETFIPVIEHGSNPETETQAQVFALNSSTKDTVGLSSETLSTEEIESRERARKLEIEISLKAQIISLVSSARFVSHDYIDFKEIWNEKIITGLGFEADELNKIEGTEILDLSEHLDSIQIRSLIQPSSIGNEDIDIWNSIPDKLESPDIDGNDLEWYDDRSGIPHEKKYFQRIRDYGLSISEKEDIISKIQLLKDDNWQLQQEDITITATTEQKKALEDYQAKLQTQVDNYKKSQQQSEALALTLRLSKTANNILGTIGNKDGSQHIYENFISGYIEALEQADPIKKISILQNLKLQLSDLLNDFYNFQTDTLGKFDEIKDDFDTSNQALIENYFGKMFDKLVTEFGQGFGDHIAEQYAISGNIHSPIGTVPTADLDNINNQIQESGYEKLYSLFEDVYGGSAKLNFNALEESIAEIQLGNNQTQDTQIPENNYPDSLQPDEYPSVVDSDDNYNIVKYTKEAFDGFFNSDKKENLGIQFGFVPFASGTESQQKIEIILSSPKYKPLFNLPSPKEVDTQYGKVTIEWSPELLSRIMFLYNRYADSMKQETQKQLNEVEMI